MTRYGGSWRAVRSPWCRVERRRAHLGAGSGRLELALVPDERVFDLDRHPEVCVCVDAYPSHETIMGVIAYGSATYGPGSTMTLRVDHAVSFDFSKAAR
jgi:hypothetical protein